MPLPSEYTLEGAIRSIDDIIVYRANHPIHGDVNVYLPDNTLPAALCAMAKNRLYENGLQMRNTSLLGVPFVTKALEVSQNPNEPYIVTGYAKHDLEELVDNGVVLKAGRVFEILSQVLEAIINLSANGVETGRLHPRQVKLSQLHSGDISFTVFEGAEPKAEINKTATAPQVNEPIETADDDVDHTATVQQDHMLLRTSQRNVYLLGSVAYQLLFGRKYQANDSAAAVDFKKLAKRWRRILGKALSNDINDRYDTYGSMLSDLRGALNRNKRVAVASIPFLVVLVIIGSYFGYQRYRRHKIMTSEAGQAIKSFLEIVNKTDDKVPELKKPEPEPPVPDEQTILKPFDKIESAE